MFARGLDSGMIAFAVIGGLCGGCGVNDGAGDDDTGQARSAIGSASAGDGRAAFEPWSGRKLMPGQPPEPPPVVDSSLPARAAARRTAIAADSAAGWTLDLEASQTSLWPSQYTTLTATTNMDVGPGHNQICIWDSKTGIALKSCTTGTACSVAVTRANADFTSFTAVVTPAPPPTVPPVVNCAAGPAAVQSFTDVYWHSTGIWLTETAPTVPVNGTTTLTALTDLDVGPSPFFVEIYDVTTATILTRCGAGTRCSVDVSQTAATTHQYRAWFTVASSSFPPPNALQCTVDQSVSWADPSGTGRVLLTVTPALGGNYTATAYSSFDVGPTPYWIQIYLLETGSRIAVCGSGTSCSATVTPGMNLQPMVGFVGPYSTTLPASPSPGTVQSNSLTVPAPPMGCQGVPITQGPVIGPSGIPGGTPFL